VIYDSGEVSLEHLLLSWYPSQRGLSTSVSLAGGRARVAKVDRSVNCGVS